MTSPQLVSRAAASALIQRRLGDPRPRRELFRASFSLLRYFHHQWEAQAA